MTLLFLQYGNYAEAWHHFRKGGSESYRDQRRSVSRVEDLSEFQPAIVMSCGDGQHDEQLTTNLRSIRISGADSLRRRKMASLVKDLSPTLAVCCSPNTSWHLALARGDVPTLPLYADYIRARTFREKLRSRALSNALLANRCSIVANHSLQASKSLRALGYSDENIIPWEFCRLSSSKPPKTGPDNKRCPRLFFAGAVQVAKGVGDCIDACQRLGSRGIEVELVIAGRGDIGRFEGLARAAGLGDRVKFLGNVPLDQVGALMRSSDIVVVPSRHEYAEGLPNVVYEALASRTPLVCSDHPAFAPRLPHRVSAMHFSAGDADSLADAIAEVLTRPELYTTLSEHSETTLDSLYVGIERLQLIEMFLADPRVESDWHRQVPSLKTICESSS